MRHNTLFFLVFIYSTLVFGHGGDNGPSSLENEFAKMSHIHLPMNFNTLEGLKLGYSLPGEHHDGHVEESEGAFESDIHPVVFAGYDRINRLLNLVPAQQAESSLDPSRVGDKFLRVESRKWNLGLGFEADIHLPIELVTFAVGLSYIKAKNYITKVLLDFKNEVRIPIEYPINSKTLSHWRVNDSMSYISSGTMVYAAMLGVEPFFHMGPEYIHSGTYRTSITLIDEKTLEVQVQTTKTNSIGIEGNALIMGAEASTGHSQMRNVVYKIDTRSEFAFSTLKKILNGRIDLANRELVKSFGDIALLSNLRSNYRSITASIGVPVLFFRGASSGKYISEGDIEDFEHEDFEKIYSTTIMSEKFSRGLISRHYWEPKSFTAAIVRDVGEDDDSVLSAQMQWSYSSDNFRGNEFTRKLNKIINLFNLAHINNLSLPYRKNGFVKVEAILNLSGAEVLYLMNGKNLKSLLSKALPTTKIKQFNRKKQKLLKLRSKIETSYNRGNLKQVTKELASFIKELLSSKNMIRVLLDMNPQLKLKLKIVGEKIRQHHYECNQVCELESL